MAHDRQVLPPEAFLTFDPPPARQPRPVEPGDHVRGRRLVLIAPDGYVYDRRAMSDPKQGPIRDHTDDDDDRWFVAVTTEYRWYEWSITGKRPEIVWWPTHVKGTARIPRIYVE